MGGSPSLARSRPIVVFTVLVKGSAISSHTFSNSSSAGTARPCADNRYSRTANSFGLSRKRWPARGDPPGRVQYQVAVLQDRWQHACGPATERPHPSDELIEIERLRQVVVGAQAEPVDAVSHGARRGQHQEPALTPVGYEGLADLVPVQARKVTVEDNDVIAVDGGVRHRIAPVQDDVDRHALAPQARGDGLGQPFVVLHNEHSHEIPFPGCQSKGDSRVTARVTVLSPLAPYNLAHGFTLRKRTEKNGGNIAGAHTTRKGQARAATGGPTRNGVGRHRLVRCGLRWRGHSSAVAHLGTTTPTTAGATASQGATGGSTYQKAVQYAQCMRKNGVPNFPGPNANGDFLFKAGPREQRAKPELFAVPGGAKSL